MYAIDTEGTGLHRHRGAEMFTFSVCDAEGDTAVWDVGLASGAGPADAGGLARLDMLWAPGAELGAHNMKFDLGMVRKRLGRRFPDVRLHETMAVAHVLDNHRLSYALDNVAYDMFGYPKDQDEIASRYLDDDWGLFNCPRWVRDPYQRADAERVMLILLLGLQRIREGGWQKIYDMECDLIRPTLDMEDRGVMIDRKRCAEMIDWCEREAQSALEDYQGVANVTTTPLAGDVAWVIEDVLGVELTKTTKSGAVSTDKFVMAELRDRTNRHPLIEAILRYRAYRRGVPIVDGYRTLADADGVIHPSIKACGTKTGRESCSEPNLQNVAKRAGLLVPYPIPARRCFRPRPGYVNVHVDYAGIEARLLTHFAGDPALRAIFAEGDGDFHSAFAAVARGEDWRLAGHNARKVMRDAVKNGDFALAYGAGDAKFLRTIGLDPKTDRAVVECVRRAFPSYCGMSRRFTREVRESGSVRTIFGRRLFVPRNKPYMGTNYVVQGSAAGILKRAQIRVDEYLRRATSGEAGMILPIHDEIVIEWPRKRLGELRGCLREIRALMIDFPQVTVPLDVDIELSTRDWATLRPYTLEEGSE